MNNEAFFIQAVESEKQGQVDLAATLYQQILDNVPDHPGTLYNFATLNAKRNNYDLAIALFERMLNVEPDFAQAYYNVAICYIKKGDVRTAMTHLKNAVTLVPHYEEAHHLLGGILLRMDMYQEADIHFKATLSVNPDNAGAHCHSGIACVHLGRMEDAREHLERSISLDSSLAEAYYHLGLVALKKGSLDEADEHFQSTVARDPSHFSAYYNLALIKKMQTQYKLAQHYIEKAHEIAPDHPFVTYLYGMLSAENAPPIAPPDFVASLFNQYAPYYDEHLTQVLNSELPATCLAVFKQVHHEPVGTTVDLGCGTGLCGTAFRDQTRVLIGVDLSEKMLEKAREKNIYDTLYQEDMLGMLKRTDHKIDLILCCDAIILAACGLERLNLGNHIRALLPATQMLPAIGQGIVVVQCRENSPFKELVHTLHDPRSHAQAMAERTLGAQLGSSCQVPIGGHASIEGDRLTLTGLVGSVDGSRILRAESSRAIHEASMLGLDIAQQLIELGALQVIEEAVNNG